MMMYVCFKDLLYYVYYIINVIVYKYPYNKQFT